MSEKSRISGWAPPPGVTLHLGGPIPPNWEFFAPPPTAIGPIVSAATTLSAGEKPMSPGLRWIFIACMTGLGIAGGIAIEALTNRSVFSGAFLALVMGGIGFSYAYFQTVFQHICTYVGAHGAAAITCSGEINSAARADVLLFARADTLRTSHHHVYRKLIIYNSTNFSFIWADIAGNPVGVYEGSHRSPEELPGADSFYCFCLAAEQAWSKWRLTRALEELSRDGTCRFTLPNRGHIAIGDGFCKFLIDGQEDRVQVRSIELHGRENITIHRHDPQPGWLWSSGEYSFHVDEMLNANLFVAMSQKFLGPFFNKP
jgi:hypothetical protein